jgi:uncharacterized protein YkwD
MKIKNSLSTKILLQRGSVKLAQASCQFIAFFLSMSYIPATLATTPVEIMSEGSNVHTLTASSIPTKPNRRRLPQKPRTQYSAPTSKMAKTILERHNLYRNQVNVPQLVWSAKLEKDAQRWANHLASLGGNQLVHSQERGGAGENLWLGTSGYFSHNQMVDSWGEEKKYFKSGNFPNVSSTGNWADVGHYTQMVWRNTTEVGCAIASAGGNDILVCRYAPTGNYIGQKVF